MRKAAAFGLLFLAATTARGADVIHETLKGYEVVPSVSTSAGGTFDATISNDETSITWQLTYNSLEGAVQQAHIHIGNRAVNGGITVFLCTNLGNGPVGVQPCPAPPTTISGTIHAVDVSPNIAATAAARSQGLNTAELDELIAAMRAGATYVNVHSTLWPGGEIRAQVDSLCSVVAGDANGDRVVNVVDVFYLINFLFASGPTPSLGC
jgi:hypothetical protein